MMLDEANPRPNPNTSRVAINIAGATFAPKGSNKAIPTAPTESPRRMALLLPDRSPCQPPGGPMTISPTVKAERARPVSREPHCRRSICSNPIDPSGGNGPDGWPAMFEAPLTPAIEVGGEGQTLLGIWTQGPCRPYGVSEDRPRKRSGWSHPAADRRVTNATPVPHASIRPLG